MVAVQRGLGYRVGQRGVGGASSEVTGCWVAEQNRQDAILRSGVCIWSTRCSCGTRVVGLVVR